VVSRRPTGNRIFSRSWDRADLCVRLRARLLSAGRAEAALAGLLLPAASPADGEYVFAAFASRWRSIRKGTDEAGPADAVRRVDRPASASVVEVLRSLIREWGRHRGHVVVETILSFLLNR